MILWLSLREIYNNIESFPNPFKLWTLFSVTIIIKRVLILVVILQPPFTSYFRIVLSGLVVYLLVQFLRAARKFSLNIMAGRFAATAGAAPPQESQWTKIVNNPIFTVASNVALFAAGVAFIQSPLMDMLVPQL